MNVLAHLLCSPGSPDFLLGNVIADLVRGRIEGRLPAGVIEGIRHHRKLDSFTDGHESFLASRRLISAQRRRYAGIIVDVVYDHFLALDWERYSAVGMDEFVERTYELLRRHDERIPDEARMVIMRMINEDWLRSYRTVEGMDRTFRRMSARLAWENPLGTAVEELEANAGALRRHFRRFFAELLAYSRAEQPFPGDAVPSA
jgi:acyl carrier protein phosphodiesterase